MDIPILQKNKQSLLLSVCLQSSQGSPAPELSLADDTDPTSRGLNPSAKTVKTEMVERKNQEQLSVQITSEDDTRAMWLAKESQERKP